MFYMVFATFAFSLESPSRFSVSCLVTLFRFVFRSLTPPLGLPRLSFRSLTSPWTLQGRSRDAPEPALGLPRLSFRLYGRSLDGPGTLQSLLSATSKNSLFLMFYKVFSTFAWSLKSPSRLAFSSEPNLSKKRARVLYMFEKSFKNLFGD